MLSGETVYCTTSLYVRKTTRITRAMVETGESAQKRVEDLIAIGLYRARTNRVKEYLKSLYKDFEQYLRPIEEVREIVDAEIAGSRNLSQDIVELRKKETH